ncbi:hypothetical protein CHH77_15300 [Shouchella clausii]|nr:hypothetical protein CHH77_15300 [Shouchella clausii]
MNLAQWKKEDELSIFSLLSSVKCFQRIVGTLIGLNAGALLFVVVAFTFLAVSSFLFGSNQRWLFPTRAHLLVMAFLF